MQTEQYEADDKHDIKQIEKRTVNEKSRAKTC